jgi:hypothetical protein
MPGKVYALLVGINDYPANVGRLTGCANDVDHFHEYLKAVCGAKTLAVEVLKDADATRANIIAGMRDHLGRAQTGDVAVLQYSGHGARCKSAAEFSQYFPDGMDEGLVCFDSRSPGGFDLADKELAVLFAELAERGPHLAAIFDCCHSGSATRSADDFINLRARQTHTVYDERPLDTYLDGYYSQSLQREGSLEIPQGRHVLLAACQRYQKAFESKDHTGVFTSTLLEVLEKSGREISYADLFVRCRAAVRKRADNQDPQFETFRGFPAYSGFLGGTGTRATRRYSVQFEGRGWRVACGAMHGLPTGKEQQVEFDLFPEFAALPGNDGEHPVGRAVTTHVGAQKSGVELLDFVAPPAENDRFQGELTTLPVPPLWVFVEGPADACRTLQERLAGMRDQSHGIALVSDDSAACRYALLVRPDRYELTYRETGQLLQTAIGHSQASAEYLFEILKRIATWERAIRLQNLATEMETDDVPFHFYHQVDGEYQRIDASELSIDVAQRDGEWQWVEGTFRAENRSQQPLYLLLVHFSEQYGISPQFNEPIEPTEAPVTITLEGESEFHITLEDEEGDQSIHRFKLIVATEPIDDFLLQQDPIEIGAIHDPQNLRSAKGLNAGSSRKKLYHRNEWFTQDVTIRLVRQLNRIGDTDAILAGGELTIKAHPTLQAGISLGSVRTTSRTAAADIVRLFEREGLELLKFGPPRGADQSVLELTDIRNIESLRDQPLEIELTHPLDDGEIILPLAFDGERFRLLGESAQDAGRTQIRIRELPKTPDDRHSPGQAIRLMFLKTRLSRDALGCLSWIGSSASIDSRV